LLTVAQVPFRRGYVVDGCALLDVVKLTVEPGHLDVEQFAPPFGGLLALGTPSRLQAGVGERGLQRLFRTAHLRCQPRAHTPTTEQGRSRAGGRGSLKKIASGR